jgi:hypothetical protein
MKYLTKVVETYRLANEKEVETFLNELKADNRFEVSKYTSTKKEVKSKGEIIDEYIRFEVTKLFNSEKEPETSIEVDYKVGGNYSESEY